MPTTYDMSAEDDLFRLIYSYTTTPMKSVPDPSGAVHVWNSQPKMIRVPNGPDVPHEGCVGPYRNKANIKSWVTRNKGRYQNFKIERVEKVTGWEEVSI